MTASWTNERVRSDQAAPKMKWVGEHNSPTQSSDEPLAMAMTGLKIYGGSTQKNKVLLSVDDNSKPII